jgi:hypothetical protein
MRAILGTALVMLLTVFAQGQEGAPAKSAQPSAEPTKLDVIQKQLSDLTLTLQSIQAADKAGENSKRLGKVENEILNLKDAVARLESALNSLKTDERRSFYNTPIPDASKPITAAKPIVDQPARPSTVGTLKLVNSTTKKAQVMLNGVAYAVEPGQTVTVPGMPTGEFNYEVSVEGVGVVQPKLFRQLGTAETFTIYVYPR